MKDSLGLKDAARGMSISSIIPTKNRPAELEIVTRDLLNQTLLPTEIIIIDQSLDDAGRKLVTYLFEQSPTSVRNSVQLKYVLDPSISGGSAARNRGMDLAIGDVWLCLDDDVELERNFIEEIIAVLRERPDVYSVCGVITNYVPPPWPFRLWDRMFALGPFHDERQPIYWNANRLCAFDPIRVHKLNGGAMAFRAELMRSLRFDPDLTGVSLAEDVDLATRMEPGIILMAPRARLIHKRSPHGRAADHWLRAQAQASYYLYRRNWRRGLPNRLRFFWLNVGYMSALALCCIKQRSREPLIAFGKGVHQARAVLNAPAGTRKRALTRMGY
jgi:GT2 family glycosyltransferase